ncbi:MAG: TlpA family protein disulfide reductase [Bacteroidales bacterium]|nr:TlpA family protein disulfide reductase [Bacteroidales bacterium]
MIRTIFIFFGATVIILSACRQKDGNFEVKGTFKQPVETSVYLGKLGINDIEPVDSFKTDANGKFVLNGFEQQAALYIVSYGNNSVYLVIKAKDKLQVEIDNSIVPNSYYVEGSSDARLVRDLVFEQEKVLAAIKNISIEYEKSKDDPITFFGKKQVFDSLYDNLLARHKEFTINFIYNNPASLACIFALYQNFGIKNQPLFDKYTDIGLFNFVDSNLSVLYPATPAVIALNRDVTEIKEQIKHKKFSEGQFQQGKKAPDFKLGTIDSLFFDLSEKRGKAVALFFFASWNKQSVHELAKINQVYKTYKPNGLEVLGVSFDKSEGALRAVLDSHDINIPVVCDYLYWESGNVQQFGIRVIPEIILIDKNHITARRGINVGELMEMLEEWRKNKLL